MMQKSRQQKKPVDIGSLSHHLQEIYQLRLANIPLYTGDVPVDMGTVNISHYLQRVKPYIPGGAEVGRLWNR